MPSDLSTLRNREIPVRKAIQRARWFLSSFREFVSDANAASARAYKLDDQKLLSAFSAWYRSFDAQRHLARSHRYEFITFTAGLMLRELIRQAPVTVSGDSTSADCPEDFWPEGYLYVKYCLAVRDAVLEQDFHLHENTAPDLDDLRTWWSFRENVHDDADSAIAFLKLFAGEEPNWSMPNTFVPHHPDIEILARTAPEPQLPARES